MRSFASQAPAIYTLLQLNRNLTTTLDSLISLRRNNCMLGSLMFERVGKNDAKRRERESGSILIVGHRS